MVVGLVKRGGLSGTLNPPGDLPFVAGHVAYTQHHVHHTPARRGTHAFPTPATPYQAQQPLHSQNRFTVARHAPPASRGARAPSTLHPGPDGCRGVRRLRATVCPGDNARLRVGAAVG